MRKYKTLHNPANPDVEAISLTEGKHAGIIFSYGKVTFDEDVDADKLTMNFEYEVHDDGGVEYIPQEFEAELGDFLSELLAYGVQENNIVYSGGVDEDRTDNT